LRLPKEELKELIPKTQVTRKIKDKTYNIYTYLIKKNEKDVIQLLLRYKDNLPKDKIRDLLDEAKSAPLFKLIVLLHQLLGNYQRCLSLFFQIRSIKEDVFSWLSEVQIMIENGTDIHLSSAED
jgi:hypothetical protein